MATPSGQRDTRPAGRLSGDNGVARDATGRATLDAARALIEDKSRVGTSVEYLRQKRRGVRWLDGPHHHGAR